MFTYILEIKKELLVCVSLSVLYLTYYLVEVVKKPILICRKGEFRQLLEKNVPILNEYYWPTPWCVESRLQTVIGSILRSLLLPPLQFRREVLKLSDGGQVALDWLEEDDAGAECRAVLLVLPGLTGGAQADYVRCLAAAARRLRAALVVFNNRGLGGLPLTTPRLYSAVSHEVRHFTPHFRMNICNDLAMSSSRSRRRLWLERKSNEGAGQEVGEAVSAVRARGVPVLAAGVSLGGLQLGRYLAEQGASAPVHAALIVSSPLDVVKGSQCMERAGLNAALSWHMARQLRGTVRARLPALAGGVRSCRSVRAFDAAFTARIARGVLPRRLAGPAAGARRSAAALPLRRRRPLPAAGGAAGARGGLQRVRGALRDGARRTHRLPGGLVAGARSPHAVRGAPRRAVLRGAAAPDHHHHHHTSTLLLIIKDNKRAEEGGGGRERTGCPRNENAQWNLFPHLVSLYREEVCESSMSEKKKARLFIQQERAGERRREEERGGGRTSALIIYTKAGGPRL
ncbi:Abhydrolase domain-containing protein 3 [Papilio xuthus]|uniref:Abhydrolase domain-containing protein 3 n=1 Tax=Papilio xuthus TaxID=66420 RepID=A0A194Q4U1_PAPXU|nr:Abhydrolase domain-containing protein 3 [Papilio xuthus]